MAIVFFEGFNYSASDIVKLNPSNWSVNNPSQLTFGTGGRTDNHIILTNRPQASGLELNTVLSLNNFTDPLIDKNGFAIGFAYTSTSIFHRPTGVSSAPHNETCVTFHDNQDNEVLRLDFIKTSGTTYGSSIGLGVYQNNSLVDTYDFKSHIGHSWSISTASNIAYISNAPTYLEFYINAKSNPHIRFNFTAHTSYEAPLISSIGSGASIPISGFNSLKTVKFYTNNNLISSINAMDDLYLSSGDNESEAFLGYNTKIYKLSLNGNSSPVNWSNFDGGTLSFGSLNSNDGDASYAISATSGNVAMFDLADLPSVSPSSVGGIKITNIVRSSSLDTDWSLTNLVSSGASLIETGAAYTVDSTTYMNKDIFLFANPITGSGWTKTDVNTLKVGIKNMGPT